MGRMKTEIARDVEAERGGVGWGQLCVIGGQGCHQSDTICRTCQGQGEMLPRARRAEDPGEGGTVKNMCVYGAGGRAGGGPGVGASPSRKPVFQGQGRGWYFHTRLRDGEDAVLGISIYR